VSVQHDTFRASLKFFKVHRTVFLFLYDDGLVNNLLRKIPVIPIGNRDP